MDDFLQQEVQYCGEGGIMNSESIPQSRRYDYDVLHGAGVASCSRSVVSEVPRGARSRFLKACKHGKD